MEKGRETKTLVPCPWVDLAHKCIYWPSKTKNYGPSIASWCLPKKDWLKYDIIQTLLEAGTREEAGQMMDMPTTTEDSASDDG